MTSVEIPPRTDSWYSRLVPGSDDLDDLIDSYVADALRATGLRAEARPKPSPSYAQPIDPIGVSSPEPLRAEPVSPRVPVPTPTGVAKLAAELFGDLADEVSPPPAPAGVSIRFSRSPATPLEPPEPPLSELYTMPALPGLAEEATKGVPGTLPGIGPVVAEPDDEPTNVVTRFPT